MAHLHTKQDIVYGNYSILHPDGTLMCRTDAKKVRWYLKKNLATQVDELTIKLNFEPKGKGNAGASEYYAEARENRCVVCGCEKDLTLHHVVPYQYRKQFPEHLKSHTSFDILPVCIKHHEEYEQEAVKLNKRLQIQYNAQPHTSKPSEDIALAKEIAGVISTLIKTGDKIPDSRRVALLNQVRSYFKDEDIWWDDLPDLIVDVNYKVESASPAKVIIEAVDDIFEFVVMWRKHFVNTMKPQHLSEKWLADMEKVVR
jgi:hypothetical protein